MSYQTRKKQEYESGIFEEPGYEPGASLYEDYVRENPQAGGSRPTYRSSSRTLGARPEYSDSYGGQMQELWQQYVSRGPFGYDATKDPLYLNYRDQYVQQGKMAMRDTMGQAAALTGGYGSTYGQSVGQQAYDAHLKSLGEVIPQLYSMAYGRYQDEGDSMIKQYQMLGDMRNDEYGRWRDAVGDWEAERSYQDAQEARDYARYRDQLADWESERSYLAGLEAEDYRRATAADETAYQREQDAFSRKQQSYSTLYATIRESGYVPTDAELAAAGMTRDAANAILAEYNRQAGYDERNMSLKEASALGGGGGGSYDGSNGGTRWNGYDPVLGAYYYDPAGGNLGGSVTSGDYERFIRDTMAADLGYMPTAGQVGWNDTAGMLDTLGIQEQTPYSGGARTKTWAEQTGNKGYTGPKTAGQDWNEIRKKLGI